MAYRVYVVTANVWNDPVLVKAASFTWSRSKNHMESGRASFQLGDPDIAEALGLYDLYPGEKYLVLDWDGTAVYAGRVLSADYRRDTQVLDVSHSDVWEMWERRMVLGDRTANVAKSKLTYSGLSLATIAKRVVQAGIAGPAAENYAMPVRFDADVSGSASRTYYGYDMMKVSEALTDIMESQVDLDIDFIPRWANGSLEWKMQIGNLTSGMLEYDLSSPGSGSKGLWFKTDATSRVNRVYGIGEGTEVDTLVRVSTSANIATGMASESAESFKDVKVAGQLLDRAQGAIVANNGTTRQAGFDVLANGAHKVSAFQPGCAVRWNVRNDPYILDGYRTWELIKYSGSLDDWVTLEFQEKEGG